MSRPGPRTSAVLRLTTPLAALLLVAGGCSGSDDQAPSGEGAPSPAEVVDQARQTLDDTTGVTITLATDELPDGVSGVTSAEGEAAHPPAFDGSFDVVVSGFPATIDVVTVDGTTYAKGSLLLPDWTEVDPATYGAPDPTVLLTPGEGFSALVDAVTDVQRGEQLRGGEGNREVLTRYTGTVPGDAVAGVVPSATGDFDVTLAITDDGELREVAATGEFYPGADALTYTIGFDDYGSTPDITAPTS